MIETIIQKVTEVTGITKEQILFQDRHQPFSDVRKIAMALGRDYSDMTWIDLGKYFQRDHATIIHAHDKTKELLIVDQNFALTYLKVQRELRKTGLRKVKRIKGFWKYKVKSLQRDAA